MRKFLFAAGLIAAVAVPAIAMAQPDPNCVRSNNQTSATGTVLGALGGALIGNAIAGRHDRGVGTVGGALAGGVAGNVLAGQHNDPCPQYDYQADGYPPPPPPPSYNGYDNGYQSPPPPPAYGDTYQGGYNSPPPSGNYVNGGYYQDSDQPQPQTYQGYNQQPQYSDSYQGGYNSPPPPPRSSYQGYDPSYTPQPSYSYPQ